MTVEALARRILAELKRHGFGHGGDFSLDDEDAVGVVMRALTGDAHLSAQGIPDRSPDFVLWVDHLPGGPQIGLLPAVTAMAPDWLEGAGFLVKHAARRIQEDRGCSEDDALVEILKAARRPD